MLITLPQKVTAATATRRLPTAAELPYSDGVPMETPWHAFQAILLKILIDCHWLGRKDFYSGVDMFMYFSEEHVFNKDFRGPDFFLVKGVDHDRERLSWVSWEEGDRLPDVIIELLSPSTRKIDRTVKKDLYNEVFHTAEYFCFDPQGETLEGWRREGGDYVPIEPDESGRLFSKELQVSFDWRNGKFMDLNTIWVRMFDANGRMLLTFDEAAAKLADEATKRADKETKRADKETKRAQDAAKQAQDAVKQAQDAVKQAQDAVKQAENEAKRAQDEAARADAAEAEVDRLRKEVEALRRQSASPSP